MSCGTVGCEYIAYMRLPASLKHAVFPSCTSRHSQHILNLPRTIQRSMSDGKAKSDSEWRAVLSPEQVRVICRTLIDLVASPMCILQFRILRQKGTEPAGTGKFDKHYDEGVYTCAGCGTPLYKSTTKFKSGCGWPAFFDCM